MVLKFILNIFRMAILFYEIALIIYLLHPFFTKVKSVFYQTLERICEPTLIPIRRVLTRYVPRKWLKIDWSPVVAVLLCGVLRLVVNLLAFFL